MTTKMVFGTNLGKHLSPAQACSMCLDENVHENPIWHVFEVLS